jgi:hypothetical protein
MRPNLDDPSVKTSARNVEHSHRQNRGLLLGLETNPKSWLNIVKNSSVRAHITSQNIAGL